MILTLLSTIKQEPNGIYGKGGLILDGSFFYPNSAFIGSLWQCLIPTEDLIFILNGYPDAVISNLKNKIRDIKFDLSKTQGVALDVAIEIDESTFKYENGLHFNFIITQCESDCS